MAILNTIALSQLEDEIRFDPQYYTPKDMLFENEISAFPTISLGAVAIITDGQHGYFKLDERSEIRQITAKCIKEGLVDKSSSDRLSSITHLKNLRSSLKKNDVLVTTAGTIGQIGLVTEEIPPANIDQDIGRIAIHNTEVSPFFVWAFLQSKFGRFQLQRFTTGQVQTHLSLKKMKKLRIPRLSNHAEVEEIVENFIASKKAAKDLYEQAHRLLETELGLVKLSFQKPVGYTVRFSELEQSRRSDSEFFNPELRHFWKNLSSRFELIALPKVASVLKFSNPTYGINGLPIVTQKHLRAISPEDYGDELRTTDSWPRTNSSAVLQHNDLLFYSVGAYLGKTNIWLNTDKAVPASFITLIRCFNQKNAGFLQVLLNSRFGILQSKCFQSGTSQQYIYPKDIRKFLMPVVDDKLKEQLHLLVVESFERKLEARNLLDQAIVRVEQLIEEEVRS